MLPNLITPKKGKYFSNLHLRRSFSKLIPLDGNTAASWVGFNLSDTAFIYPITPSSSMGEVADQWSAEGKKNIFGQVPHIQMMQSEAGAAGSLHGSSIVGSLTTTFTASQGLLLMIPNMYKIAGELLPTVFHVSARALSRQALSIFGDHSDVMGVRQTGFSLLSSSTVQEIMDLGTVAHLSSIESRIPFLHFFEGFRLSHEVNSIHKIEPETFKKLINYDAVRAHRARALNPEHPLIFGHSMGPATYFQTEEAANPFYNSVPKIVQKNMDLLAKHVGRQYHLFDYYGHPEAERVIILMGAGAPVVEECVNYLLERNEKVGVVKVRLYRPFDATKLFEAIPKSCKKIAVLDRTKESGSVGEPLFLDVLGASKLQKTNHLIVGGRFGLASREFTPGMALSVFKNLEKREPKNNFTVGINDDVTYTSLEEEMEINTVPNGTSQAIFWGLGSDGTVSANKTAIKLIVKNTDLYGQGYFSYSADKSNALTQSFLRFGPNPISSEYQIVDAEYVACHNSAFMAKYNMTKNLIKNGIFVLNTSWLTLEELEKNLPQQLKKSLAEKNCQFYVIDASKIAEENGLPGRINMIMQSVFFKLTKVIPEMKALELLKEQVGEMFKKYGKDVVQKNKNALDQTYNQLQKINFPIRKWKNLKIPQEQGYETGQSFEKNQFTHESFASDLPENRDPNSKEPTVHSKYVKQVLLPLLKMEGSNLPSSSLPSGGIMPLGTSKYIKKGIAQRIPIWNPKDCIQCNLCSFVCPHSCIRPFVVEKNTKRPKGFVTKDAKEKNFKGKDFRIQISPYDCVSCSLCVQACPKGCLSMESFEKCKDVEQENWEFAEKLPVHGDEVSKFTVAGSQYQKPLLEFPPSCAGCGETQLVKIVTQLFGDRMTIANSSGCSSVWGGRFPVCPFTTNEKGHGPAWGRSLFEDTAEYGFGMAIGTQHRRKNLKLNVDRLIKDTNVSIPSELKDALTEWTQEIDNTERSIKYGEIIKKLLKENKNDLDLKNPLINEIINSTDLFIKKSHWVIGGDGFAYDIGYGGLDYVVSNRIDVNILILDTEVYSNTGAQMSRSTMAGAIHKFAASGKIGMKKDLGSMVMSYGSCYVCSVALGSKYFKHAINALKEAESYPGPSLILAYTNCIAHGIGGGMGKGLNQVDKLIDTGYLPIYTFDPRKADKGKNPFKLSSKEPKYKKIIDHMLTQTRFKSLKILNPEIANLRFSEAVEGIRERYENLWIRANKKKIVDNKKIIKSLKKSKK
ncbi:pyruvate-flavodoxin oxidoreductase-related [Anaeramoeba flamelloides]|uniref:Pyruvate-flavodoxin oxidoreductase-related n=1 Tax=Anaeramoeba flamelloides TaxID=1746091 RepID=A0AAV7YT70_9EUKA|nr:pyruvate-flavodoxin oxidoreductase-related [Anaeramoeba flamelloides]